MNIYTLFLYIAIAGAAMWATIGFGHAKLKKYDVSHPVTWFWQYFLGALLVFSGFVKAVDPLGTAYKMKDYFAEFKAQGLPFMDFMKDWSVSFSVFMIVVEMVVGFCLILGIGGRKNLGINLLMMLFFTFLTGFNYLTGFTPRGESAETAVGILQFSQWTAFDNNNIRISDCGCFGDFIKLQPIETFLKDIFLTGISIYLFRFPERLKDIVPATRIRTILTAVASAATLGFCLNNFYFNDAYIDFRPFAEGVNIPAAKEECKKNAPVVEMTFIYKNQATGETQQFDAKNLPKDTTWKYVDRKDKVVKEGCKSKVMELTQFPEIEDYTQFPELAKSNGYALLVVAADLDKADRASFKQITTIARAAEERDSVPTYALYYNIKDQNGNGQDDEIDAFRHEVQAGFHFAFGDEKLVLTIMRANPGLILFHKGTIVKKWHHKHLPATYDVIKTTYMK